MGPHLRIGLKYAQRGLLYGPIASLKGSEISFPGLKLVCNVAIVGL